MFECALITTLFMINQPKAISFSPDHDNLAEWRQLPMLVTLSVHVYPRTREDCYLTGDVKEAAREDPFQSIWDVENSMSMT